MPFTTANITQIETDQPSVYAFRLTRHLGEEEVEAMAQFMNDVFDRAEASKVDMVMIFDGYEGTSIGPIFDTDVIKSRWRSLSSVGKYAVVGAPEPAKAMIGTLDKLLPVHAAAFDTIAIHDAWAFVGALPTDGTLTGKPA